MRYYVNFSITVSSYSAPDVESRQITIEAQDIESLLEMVKVSGAAISGTAEHAVSDFVLSQESNEVSNE